MVSAGLENTKSQGTEGQAGCRHLSGFCYLGEDMGSSETGFNQGHRRLTSLATMPGYYPRSQQQCS